MLRPPEVGESKIKVFSGGKSGQTQAMRWRSSKYFQGQGNLLRGQAREYLGEIQGEDSWQHCSRGVCLRESGGRKPHVETHPTTLQPSLLWS